MYIDSIIDALARVHIFEMAHQRKSVIDKTRNLSSHIARHIFKVALWPEHSARKSWEKEIHAACSNVSDLIYAGKKRLKAHEYFQHLYTEPIEDTDLVQHIAKSSVRNDSMDDHKWTDEDYSVINHKVKNLYHELSSQLASNNYLHIESTLKKHHL